MRLAVEITTCTATRTGVGYYAERIVDALLETRQAGDEVALLSNRLPAPELTARWAPYLRVRGPGLRVLWMQSEVPGLLAETQADVALFPNYAVPLASPCPTMVVVHDLAILRTPQNFTAQKRLMMRAVLRRSIAAASVVGTVSEASRRDIAGLLDVRDDRIALLPAAAHSSYQPAPREVIAEVCARHGLHRPYVLTVGTLEPRKGLPTLLRAFDRLPDTIAHDLVVVGPRGWLDGHLLKQLESRAESQRVHWLGYVTEADLVALYSGADLFLLASTLEGFGLPLLEAMACGTPVIASDVAALREVGGDVPTFVPATDEAAFARAIQQSLSDPEAMARARAAGIARARQFSWTRTAEAVWSRAHAVAPERIRPRMARHRPTPPESVTALPAPLDPPPAALGARAWALLCAVVYADLFDSPLPLDEACLSSFGVVLDEAEVRRLVRGPHLEHRVTLREEGYLALAGREALVEAMPERTTLTRQMLERNRTTLNVLAALPFVRAILISGGMANKNPGTRPDVDLFIVAARGHAYTAYTMLFLATKLSGNRRLICPNYLVDESELAIAYHRDLFTAHQVQSSRPFSGAATYQAFCDANQEWVREFFPGFAGRPPLDASRPSAAQRAGEVVLGRATGAVERGLRWAWRARLRRRAVSAPRSDVVLGDGILKLHLSDYRPRVLERFAARLATLRAQLDEARPAPRFDPVRT